MGGAIEIVSSSLGMAQDIQGTNTRESAATRDLRAEREAQEAEQQELEAEERRKDRQQISEARAVQRKRLANGGSGQTTLTNGGVGLTDDPEVSTPQLKQKFGE